MTASSRCCDESDTTLSARAEAIQLKKTTAAGVHCVTAPAHKALAKGTLSDILNRVSQWNGISREELLAKL